MIFTITVNIMFLFDAAIYVPNPNNATDDDYEPFHLGNESDVFLKNQMDHYILVQYGRDTLYSQTF